MLRADVSNELGSSRARPRDGRPVRLSGQRVTSKSENVAAAMRSGGVEGVVQLRLLDYREEVVGSDGDLRGAMRRTGAMGLTTGNMHDGIEAQVLLAAFDEACGQV